MDEWNQAGANFDFVEDEDAGNGVHCYDMGTWSDRLGLAFVYPGQANTTLYEVQIVVNSYWTWDPAHPKRSARDASGDVYNLETLMKHELGHALWLGHSQDSQSIMYLPIAPNGSARNLSDDDEDGIKFLYP